MAISETAQKNHDELFPGYVSTLTVTDPELIEVFDNFAFDEVLRHSRAGRQDPADGAARRPYRLPGAQRVPSHARRRAHRRGHSGRSEGDRVPGRAVYAGMGRVFDFIHVTNERPDRARHLSCRCPGRRPRRPESRVERGREVQEQIVGADRVARMYAVGGRATSLHFQRFLSGQLLRRLPHPHRASACPTASCSPSRCWPLWADATPRSEAMWRPTSTSVTPGRTLLGVLVRAAAVHRLPAHAQRTRRSQRGRARSQGRTD